MRNEIGLAGRERVSHHRVHNWRSEPFEIDRKWGLVWRKGMPMVIHRGGRR